MAHAYTIIPAKPAFGNYAKNLSGTDIVINKRINSIYCSCQRKKQISAYSQSDLLNIRKITSNNCKNGCNVFPINKSELQINLLTELYLQDIVVLSENSDPGTSAKINPALVPVFSYYTLDPSNNLTGNTPCGIQKFVNYMILNTGTIPPVNPTPIFCQCPPSY